MSRTKVLRRAALLVASAAELLLTTSSTAPYKGEITPPMVEPGDGWTQLWEPRYCTACDQEGPFWAIYEPEGEETHAYMTMCMTCGAINGDLPEEDPAHWLNVFRSEPHHNSTYTVEPDCTVTGLRETVCFRCSWRETELLPALGHQYGLWAVETPPGPGTEGTETRACVRCGETQRRSVPALPTGIPEVTERPSAPPEPAERQPATAEPTEPPVETMQPVASADPYGSQTPSAVPEPKTTAEPVPDDTARPLQSNSPIQTETPETDSPEPAWPAETPSPAPSARTDLPEPTDEIPAETAPWHLPEEREPAPEWTVEPKPAESPVPPAETPSVRPAPLETAEPSPVPERRAYGPYVSGTPEGLFLPERPATRADVLVMLARLLADQSGDVLPAGRQIYKDVPADCWYSPGVTYLADLGLLPEGGEEVLLEPAEPVSEAELTELLRQIFHGTWTGDTDKILTRAECVVWINRAAGRVPDPVWLMGHLDTLKTFPDLPAGDGARSNVLDAANGNRERVH